MKFVVYLIVILFFIDPVSSKELLNSREYKIEFYSKNIKEKKQEIIDEIKYDSFNKIIISFITNDEYNKLNKIIDIEFINKFVFSIDIYEEKINNNTYTAKIKVNYDNSKIIDFLINHKINFISYEPEEYLLIIFDQKLFSEKILSKDNRFYRFLSDNKFKYKYFQLPNLDINDRFIINKEDFFLKKIKHYDELINKYKNTNIILIHSVSESNKTKIYSYVNEFNNFKKLDDVSYKIIDYEFFFNSLHNKALDYWKNKNNVNPSLINNLNCKIKTINLSELKAIKDIINKNKMINRIEPNEISYNNSNYKLVYFGKFDILVKSLKKDKIQISLLDNSCNIKIL